MVKGNTDRRTERQIDRERVISRDGEIERQRVSNILVQKDRETEVLTL
jgi:hypothetical protein